jgi:hypothetical protein
MVNPFRPKADWEYSAVGAPGREYGLLKGDGVYHIFTRIRMCPVGHDPSQSYFLFRCEHLPGDYYADDFESMARAEFPNDMCPGEPCTACSGGN